MRPKFSFFMQSFRVRVPDQQIIVDMFLSKGTSSSESKYSEHLPLGTSKEPTNFIECSTSMCISVATMESTKQLSGSSRKKEKDASKPTVTVRSLLMPLANKNRASRSNGEEEVEQEEKTLPAFMEDIGFQSRR